MQRVTLGFSTAQNGRAFTFDRDCILVSVACRASSFVVSSDPSHTIANVITAPADGLLPGILFTGSGTVGGVTPDLNIAMTKGEQIFLSVASACPLMLFIEDFS